MYKLGKSFPSISAIGHIPLASPNLTCFHGIGFVEMDLMVVCFETLTQSKDHISFGVVFFDVLLQVGRVPAVVYVAIAFHNAVLRPLNLKCCQYGLLAPFSDCNVGSLRPCAGCKEIQHRGQHCETKA